jgi:hypothetical protein
LLLALTGLRHLTFDLGHCLVWIGDDPLALRCRAGDGLAGCRLNCHATPIDHNRLVPIFLVAISSAPTFVDDRLDRLACSSSIGSASATTGSSPGVSSPPTSTDSVVSVIPVSEWNLSRHARPALAAATAAAPEIRRQRQLPGTTARPAVTMPECVAGSVTRSDGR